MRARVQAAATEGLVLGVKWGVAFLVVVFLVTWAFQDYSAVRVQARQGAAAYQALQQAQRKPPPPPVTITPNRQESK